MRSSDSGVENNNLSQNAETRALSRKIALTRKSCTRARFALSGGLRGVNWRFEYGARAEQKEI